MKPHTAGSIAATNATQTFRRLLFVACSTLYIWIRKDWNIKKGVYYIVLYPTLTILAFPAFYQLEMCAAPHN